MPKLMRVLVFCLMLVARASPAEESVPPGVTYHSVANGINDKARVALADAIGSRHFKDFLAAGDRPMLIGPFLYTNDLGGTDLSSLKQGIFKAPTKNGSPLILKGAMAIAQDDRAKVAAAIADTVNAGGSYHLRKLTAAEMVFVWYIISWDFQEPLWVADDGKHRYLFSFSDDGAQVGWVEDLSKPCISASREDGSAVKACFHVKQDGGKYSVDLTF